MTYQSSGVSAASQLQNHIAWWLGDANSLYTGADGLRQALEAINKPLFAVLKDGQVCFADCGDISFNLSSRPLKSLPMLAFAPPTPLETLGDCSFCADHGIKYPLIGGSMAHGISSTDIATELGQNGMLAFIGSAGDSPSTVEKAILRMKSLSEPVPFGFNLIFSPNETGLEDKMVDLYLKHEIHLIEASAYLSLTLPLVRYRVYGIYEDENGNIITPNKIIAKVSRVEVASKFFAPPPEAMLNKLVEQGVITSKQALLASKIPVAQDLTSEADSGGHTDNRPAVSLHPTMVALKNRMQSQYQYALPLRVGFGGGNGTPASVAACFAMGAAYVVVGTVHQACVESGTSDAARAMLANASQADVAMAPAGDMFEMGVTVQVLKRGTMFAMRAQKLYEYYRKYSSIDEIPQNERLSLEKNVFQATLNDIWAQTAEFFKQRDTAQLERANADPHHKMALIFRWYLGKSSRWATNGDERRKIDYQIWCGPSIGAFNEWCKGSFLELQENRRVVCADMNLLYGAALELRLSTLRQQGIVFDSDIFAVRPQTLDEIKKSVNM